MTTLSLLLIFWHALRFRLPVGHTAIIGLDLSNSVVIVSVLRGDEHAYIAIEPGTRRARVRSAIGLLCQDLEASHLKLHPPDALDIGPIVFTIGGQA